MSNKRTMITTCLTMLSLLALLGVCWGGPPPPSTPMVPPGSFGGAIYAAIIAGIGAYGYWRMRK